MADDDTLTTASTYWRDAAVLAETFQQKKAPPPKPPTPDLTGMPKLKEHVDAWIERVERITRWTCPKETRHKVDVLGAKTRDEESRWRAQEIRRRTPAPK